ncbi:MAG: 5'/3'-nucleotidase SurE [Treponema sp.]|jgi:5'-nucleotidase|nr:5'/3'-nucleotidase SurE [Treponema sp.]
MNILLTNDDGIDCEGLLRLADMIRSRQDHTVYVLAPDKNRSGVSHSISFFKGPIRLTPHGENAWACSGTPADCVMMAILGALPVKPDLVVSGINEGANIGTDIIYSGTAAAARQAGLYRVPAVALSLVGSKPFYWDQTVAYAVEHLEEFAGLWKPDTFINVNIPNAAAGPEGMVMTVPSRHLYQNSLSVFDAPDGATYCFINWGNIAAEPESGSDWDAVSRNLVSISPVFLHPVVQQPENRR